MLEHFAHVNHIYQPSSSSYGKSRQTVKSETIKLLSNLNDSTYDNDDATKRIVIDGSVVVQMLSPKTAKTFDEFSKKEFSNYIVSKVNCKITKIDIIFDVYKEKSIKAEAREKKGTATRIKFTAHTPIIYICKK